MNGLRPIEDIVVGDLVWSRDESTGEVTLREVTALFVTPDQDILEVELESEGGKSETIGVTFGHPFWVIGEGWVQAGKLRPGDQLFSLKGGGLRVRRVQDHVRPEAVYNFSVAGLHSYFVGTNKLWAHNQCKDGANQSQDPVSESSRVENPNSPAAFEAYKDELRATMERPHVEDPELSNLLDDLYRSGAKEGSGSSAAALRKEKAEGIKVGGKEHLQKVQDYVRALKKWLADHPTARPGDRAAAENVLRDMENSLNGK